MRVLSVADYIPYPLIGGGRIRHYHLLRQLAKEHEVTLAGFLQWPEEAQGIPHLREFLHRVETVPVVDRPKLARLPGVLDYTLRGIPFELEWLRSAQMADTLRRLVAEEEYDIVHLEHSVMAPYLRALPPGGREKRFLTLHNVGWVQSGRIAQFSHKRSAMLRSWLHARLVRRWLPRFAERFDRVITVSEMDRDLLIKANPRLRIDAVPNGVDAQAYRPLPPGDGRPALLYIGTMNYAPGVDGALWFVNDILPRIRRLMGEVEVWIVGRSPAPEVAALDGGGVRVTGTVPDVVPYYERSAVSVVPLRAGSGTRLKILEAMALGRPVVSTSIGCEGLEVEDERHLLVADDADEFALKTARLLADAALYRRLATEARRLVERRYDWSVIGDQLLDLYAHATGRPRPVPKDRQEVVL